MANWLTNTIREIRPNALWDIIKWIILGVAAVIGLIATAIIQRLKGIPYDFVGILILGVIWFVIVIVAYAVGRYVRKKVKPVQNVNENVNTEGTKTVEELTEELRRVTRELDCEKIDRKTASDLYQQTRHDNDVLQASLSSKIQELESYEWLFVIAKNDKATIRQLILVEVYEPTHFNLECEDAPYIEFMFGVRNASVYPISVEDDVKGKISYREPNYLLSAAPSITENKATDLQHGNRGTLKLYQSLAPHECQLIRKFTKENPKQPYYTKVNLEKVSIFFTVDYQNGAHERVELRLPPTADLPIWY